MWSTVSAPGAPVVASKVGFAGFVKTTSGLTSRALRSRRVGAGHLCGDGLVDDRVLRHLELD